MVVESMPDWFVVVGFVTFSVVAVYRLWVRPGYDKDRNRSYCDENDV